MFWNHSHILMTKSHFPLKSIVTSLTHDELAQYPRSDPDAWRFADTRQFDTDHLGHAHPAHGQLI
jgi:hypothetical protein